MPRRSDKRERLLDAAAELFWRDGYSATSLAIIADYSEVPLGNVYYYFKTKQAIAESVAELFLSETKTSFEAIALETKEAENRVRGMITLFRDGSAIRTALGCPLSRGASDFAKEAPKATDTIAETFVFMIGWLTEALLLGGLNNAPRLARMAIMRWQGAIALAHAMKDERVLLDALSEIEADLLIALRG